MTKILVVDDDRPVREALDRALRAHGYEVVLAADGLEAVQAAGREEPDVIVLDAAMPGVDGSVLVRRLREDGDDTPILVLSPRGAAEDPAGGPAAGADYLVRPFSLDELLARLRALLRRAATVGGSAGTVLRYGDLELDRDTLEVARGDRAIDLTRTEYVLLELFMANPEQVLTRDVIHERVWGYDASSSSNALEVHVSYLRRKLEADGEPRIIQTVRGFGYVLRDEP